MVELLVVIAIISVLAAMLLPALAGAKSRGRRTACISNLRQQGVAICLYAADSDGRIPYGPKAPQVLSPSDLYTSTGAPTSLISAYTGVTVGLGLMLSNHLANEPTVLFCPGSDQTMNVQAELAKVGKYQSQCSYYYRHGGNTRLFDSYTGDYSNPDHIRLDSLGENRNGQPIRALVMDCQTIVPDSMGLYGIHNSTQHQRRFSNILYSDTHVTGQPNKDAQFTLDLNVVGNPLASYNLMLQIFEHADSLP
jgi:hypothetical protein